MAFFCSFSHHIILFVVILIFLIYDVNLNLITLNYDTINMQKKKNRNTRRSIFPFYVFYILSSILKYFINEIYFHF